MNPQELIAQLRQNPTAIEFAQVIEVIEQNYDFQPTAFVNGELSSEAGQNSGSCKLFSFAQIHALNVEETLALFGAYYREDVLAHPEGDDHGNIRNFMRTGWAGIQFSGTALTAK